MLTSLGIAQDTIDPNSRLVDIRIVGTTELLSPLVEINLSAREGTTIGDINLEAERNRILAMGTFAEVSISLEASNTGPVLVVRVKENPQIAEIVIEGSSYPQEDFLAALAEVKLLAPGRTYNSIRAQEAIATIQQIYRQAPDKRFPFDVPVVLSVTPLSTLEGRDAPLQLTYRINETVPFNSLNLSGNTIFSVDELKAILAKAAIETEPIFNAETGSYRANVGDKSFDVKAFQDLRREFNDRYAAKGYRGSGLDSDTSELSGSELNLVLRELRIASVNTTAIGVDPGNLVLKAGDLFNYDQLLADVKRLAQGRTVDINLQYTATAEGEVRVIFLPGAPASAGVISAIIIEGNTAIGGEEITALLGLKVGDTFTSAVAQDDFRKIQELYVEKGYLVLEPDFRYEEGRYIQHIRESVIQGYDISFETPEERRTGDRVILRYLPQIGSLYSQESLRSGILDVARLGIVEFIDVVPSFPDEEHPEQVVVKLSLRERPTRSFSPTFQYTTDNGLSTAIEYEDANFLGQAHDFQLSLSGHSSDLGLLFGGRLTYTIPWLDIDALDFQEVPTSVSGSIFSLDDSNQKLIFDATDKVYHPCVAEGCEEIDANKVKIGEYTRRDSGVSFSVGRPVADFTRLNLGARLGYTNYTLEPPPSVKICQVTNNQVVDNDCFLTEAQAASYMPFSGLSSFVSANTTYDNRDLIEFPTEGIKASGTIGVGFGNDYRDPNDNTLQRSYIYPQFEVGFRTYYALQPKNHVLALRVNGGLQFGNDYPSSKIFLWVIPPMKTPKFVALPVAILS
ncbi:MAG: POTRA domain-containing protein [Deinococcales bacterium]